MIHVYIDNEFDAVRMQGRYLQQVIAIGACLCDDAFVHIDSFYSLVCPAGFRRLSPHVRRMTHLKDTEIQKASKFPQVALCRRGSDLSVQLWSGRCAHVVCQCGILSSWERTALCRHRRSADALVLPRPLARGSIS